MASMKFTTVALALALIAGISIGRAEASTLTYDLVLSNVAGSIDGTFSVNDTSTSNAPTGSYAITALSLDVNGALYNFNSSVSSFATLSKGALTGMYYIGSANGYQLDLGTSGLGYVLINLLSSTPILTGGISASATPLPSGLPLFLSGLVALGFLGWRKKRAARAQNISTDLAACAA